MPQYNCTNCTCTGSNAAAFRRATNGEVNCVQCFRESGQRLDRDTFETTIGEFTPCRSCDACGATYGPSREYTNSDYYCRSCARKSTWDNTGFHDPFPTYRRTQSERKYGVEIETHVDTNHRQLRPNTCFASVPDGSTNGMEFVSPVLYGDGGLDEVKKVCDFARDNDWSVNSACGLHLHCDVSEESDETLKKIAIAYHYTYEFWTSFVSESRKRNYYCSVHRWGIDTLEAYDCFMDWVNDIIGSTRYTWCNWNSYSKHKTVELRFHSATLSANKITKFIKANLRFIDWVKTLSFAELNDQLGGTTVKQQFDVISECWGESVSDFYKERAESFGKPIVSTPMVGAS